MAPRRDTSDIRSVTRVLNYQHPWLSRRLALRCGLTPAEAEDAVKDMLRFLYLCGRHPDETWHAPRRIELCWREFILYTRDYHAFCETHFGRYIHYDPEASEEPADAERRAQTLDEVRSIFGQRLSPNWE
jgi:hypothetical protein